MDNRSLNLLFCLLYLLKEETKKQITFYYDSHILDQVFYGMVKRRLLPDWFCEDFTYDSLYAHSQSLRHLFTKASRLLLIDLGGSKIQLTLDEREYRDMKDMLEKAGLPEEFVKSLSATLEVFLALSKEEFLVQGGGSSR
jgi:hypothetical protein